ncbi:hypothetical protein EJ08DRAFT_555407, partial [Tothia fuscella]
MVTLKHITANNTHLSSATKNLTAVFLGATNGIGLGTLKALTTHTDSPTIFVVGRKASSLSDLIANTLKPLNSNATFHPIIASDLTLISSTKDAAQQIVNFKGIEKIDLLVMSPGYISLLREMSPEGVDRLTAIRYYSRMRFLMTLLPLLRKSSNPRVVSVLGAGQEGQLWPEDWTMEKHWGLANAAGASGSLKTLMLEQLSEKEENKNISFVHLFPGLVGDTGLKFEGLGFITNALLVWIGRPLVWLFSRSGAEAGERVLYAATSEK